MSRAIETHYPPLHASSPFELRGTWTGKIPDADVHKALATGEMGFLHSFTTGSTVDGPGVRVVAWTTGCQFRCLYCHNPDTWNLNKGIPVTIKRATEELRKYRHGLKTMEGGFTLSGGEPLMQDRFVVRLLDSARAMGIHTALDTNGSLGSRLTDAELDAIDLVLLDIKCWDPQGHQGLTGMEVGPVLDFARRLASRNRPVWLRYVLVPGLTDRTQDIAHLATFAAEIGNVQRVDILPFHQLGRFKWKELNLNYTLDGMRPPAPDVIQMAREQFCARGLKVY
jgi:pyruvate formate lyase activating enzyme